MNPWLHAFLNSWRTRFRWTRRDYRKMPHITLARWPGVSHTGEARLLGFGFTVLIESQLRHRVIEVGHLWLLSLSLSAKADTRAMPRPPYSNDWLYEGEIAGTLTVLGVMFRFKVQPVKGARAWIVAGGKTRCSVGAPA